MALQSVQSTGALIIVTLLDSYYLIELNIRTQLVIPFLQLLRSSLLSLCRKVLIYRDIDIPFAVAGLAALSYDTMVKELKTAVPSMLTVAPIGRTKDAILFDTPTFSSTTFIVTGSVAPEELVEKAINIIQLLGHEIAAPQDARQMLKLRNHA